MATKQVPEIPRTQFAQIELPKNGYVRIAGLLPHVPVGRSTLWQWVKEQKFPAPVKLSENITAWRCEDVWQWLEAKQAKVAA